MCTVSAAAVLGCLVDDSAGNVQVLDVQALGLSVSLGVLQKINNVFDRLDGPATLGGLELLGLSGAADTTVETAERNALLLLSDILQIGISLVQLHALNGGSNFVGVLELDMPK